MSQLPQNILHHVAFTIVKEEGFFFLMQARKKGKVIYMQDYVCMGSVKADFLFNNIKITKIN